MTTPRPILLLSVRRKMQMYIYYGIRYQQRVQRTLICDLEIIKCVLTQLSANSGLSLLALFVDICGPLYRLVAYNTAH